MQRLNKLRIRTLHIPPAINAFITILSFFLVVILFIAIFVPILADEAKKIAEIDYQSVAESFRQPIQQIETILDRYHLIDTNETTLEELIKNKLVSFISAIEFSNIANNLFGILGNTFIAILSIGFVTFFFLKEAPLFTNIIYALTPDQFMEKMEKILSSTKELLTRYFIGIIIQISIIATLVTIGLTLIGLGETNITFKLALLIGMFAGFINIIPYAGPLIGASFGIILCISTNMHLDFYSSILPLFFKVSLVFFLVQLVDNFISQPFIFSTSVKAHPLEIFIVILASASIAGIAGMIIAIPVYTILRIIGREFFSQIKFVRKLTSNI